MRRTPSSPPDLPGYSPLGLLGSGGFADVFLYEQRLPRRKVAVKVLLADDIDQGTRAQFVAEANLMARLSAHPYIVTIFHADVSADGRPYFVMEYCSGPSLSERYKRQPLTVEDALRTGIRLSGAVATAHAAGILHRDIKPANVLTNDYGWPALSDFGISSDLEGELPVHTMSFTGDAAATGAGTGSDRAAVGMSVPWSPPELFEDDPRPDTRSDVFALAATVHTLLAGRTPFEVPGRSNGPLDLIGRIERGRITPIDRDDVPESLQQVLATGMAVRREDRFQSAVEFGRALQRIELELGYSVTGIEVPAIPAAVPDDPESTDASGDRSAEAEDATRARSVRVVQPDAPVGPAGPWSAGPPIPAAVPDDHATRARGVRQVSAQEPIDSWAGPASDLVDDGTVLRGASSAARRGGSSTVPGRVIAPAAEPAVDPAEPSEDDGHRPGSGRRRVVAITIGAAASVALVAAVGAAIVLGGSLAAPDPSGPAKPASAEDAVVAATVPAPEVAPGEPTGDGRVVFAVRHDRPEAGDRYRWRNADGSGTTAVAEGPEIVVDGADGRTVCIEVQVQRGSKTSEAVTGCSA